MRITLNEVSQQRLLKIMSQRGVENLTHMLNVLLFEASEQQLVPKEVDKHGNNKIEFQQAV
jgi:hypothetical protein